MSWENRVRKLYSTPGESSAFSSVSKLHRILKEEGYTATRTQLQNWINKQHSYVIHRHRVAKFKRNPVIARYPDHNWQADILFLDDIKTFNNNKPCILLCVDVVSRYVWAEAMRSKKGTDTTKAFHSILSKSKRCPEKLQTDKGNEFYNKNFKALLKKYNIRLYSTESDKKAAIAERCIKELKKLIYRYMTEYQTNRYIDRLQDLVETYNSTYHSAIGMAPKKVDDQTTGVVLQKLYGHLWAKDQEKPKNVFQPGDKVRISVSNDLFRKGYKGYWSNEVFIIHQVRDHHPHSMYVLKDSDGEMVKGAFYEKELQKVYQESERFTKISKIWKQKFIGGKLWYLVSWENEPQTVKRWIRASTVSD